MSLVVGVDEVGRGPLAGPVLAAAVVLPKPIEGVTDSKKLTPRRRDVLDAMIRADAMVAVGAASVAEIEKMDILQATLLAMSRAVRRLRIEPTVVMIDGNHAPELPWPTRCVVGGDATIAEIGAASIVAKVVRDHLMCKLAARYPGYLLERNAGYGTPQHLAALDRLGLTPHHRRTFAPVKARIVDRVEAPSAGRRARAAPGSHPSPTLARALP